MAVPGVGNSSISLTNSIVQTMEELTPGMSVIDELNEKKKKLNEEMRMVEVALKASARALVFRFGSSGPYTFENVEKVAEVCIDFGLVLGSVVRNVLHEFPPHDLKTMFQAIESDAPENVFRRAIGDSPIVSFKSLGMMSDTQLIMVAIRGPLKALQLELNQEFDLRSALTNERRVIILQSAVAGYKRKIAVLNAEEERSGRTPGMEAEWRSFISHAE
jgi:hypothetical protein